MNVPTPDPLAVALIRALNAREARGATDEQLAARYGQAAQPLADALREAMRDELRRLSSDARRGRDPLDA